MQKSRNTTIFILIIMFAYFLFSQFYLKALGSIYVYIINPIFFILMAIGIKLIITTSFKSDKFKKIIFQYVNIALSVYILIYFLSGLFFTYGKNPYSIGIKGTIYNLYSVGLVILCREYIRYKLINNIPKKDMKIGFVLIVAVFSIQDIVSSSIQMNFSIQYIFKVIFSIVIPCIMKNCLYTYISQHSKYTISTFFEMILYFIQWIPPILPKTPWIFNTMIDVCIPFVLLMHCIYYIETKDLRNIVKEKRPVKPKGFGPMAIIVIVVVWFFIGIFPIKPMGIATGSMVPELKIGDLVFIKKCGKDQIGVNDILEYKGEERTVVHRVIKKYEDGGKTFFITKGDNNSDPDSEPVNEEQAEGKVIAKIRYLAYPTVWITRLFSYK